jgi:hypothetical protein
MKTKLHTIALAVLFALSFGIDVLQYFQIEGQAPPITYEQTSEGEATIDLGRFPWAVKVVWDKTTRLGGGPLPGMDDNDTDVDWVIINAKYPPDSTIVARQVDPPVEGYTLKKIIKSIPL